MTTTHIFCFMSKTEGGKKMFLNNITSNFRFMNKNNIELLTIGTTRKMRDNEKDGKQYHFFSVSDYKSIPEEDLVEYRSYYTLTEGVVYYFTKSEYLNISKNIICTVTPYQYENFKYWCEKENIKKYGRYKLHLIYIDSDIKIRINRALNKIETEEEMCELARRLIQDKNEFDDISRRIPELIDPMLSNNVCYIINNSDNKDEIRENIKKIRGFIERSIN